MIGEKINAISKYLFAKFPGSEIEQNTNHKVGQPWSFKIHLPDATFLLLKVDDSFVKDNDILRIHSCFNIWRLTEKLGKEKKQGVLVSERGLKSFPSE